LIHLFDANSWVRERLEADKSGLAIRNIHAEIDRSTDVNIVVWDGFGGNEKRRAIYPKYKTGRHPLTENIAASFKLVAELLRHTPALQIKLPGFEADDVIAYFAAKFGPREQVRIHTTDGDLTALCALPGVSCVRDPPHSLPASLVRLYKICVGDPSDTISGIPGFGDKSWERASKPHLADVIFKKVDPYALMPALNITERFCDWIKWNRDHVDVLRKLVEPWPIPDDLISGALSPGKRNKIESERILASCLMSPAALLSA
jgi:hypothetical protein